MKRYTFPLIALAFAVVAIIFLIQKQNIDIKPIVETPLHTEGELVETMLASNEGGIKIEVKYPQFTGDYFLPASAQESINKKIKDYAEDPAREFVARHKGDAVEYEYLAKYRIEETDAFLNIYFEIYNDTGGAHGLSFTDVLTLDKETGEEIGLSELFTNEAEALKALPDLVKGKLTLEKARRLESSREEAAANIEEQIIGGGLKATSENYATFALLPDGVEFWFGRYQIGAYVEGEYSVVVPYASLSPYLAPPIKSSLSI